MPFTLANKLTIGRILSVPFLIAAAVYYVPQRDYLRYVAFGIFFLAIITDVIDGYIARRHHQKTMAGAILDPLADKFLLVSAFVCLFMVKSLAGPFQIPMSILLVVLSRDIILLVGSMVIYLVRGKIDIVPSAWGKTTTFFQVTAITAVFLRLPIFPYIWYAVAVFTVISGLDYIKNGMKVLNAHHH
jgi:cardiolipin synthase (CMP-forming)